MRWLAVIVSLALAACSRWNDLPEHFSQQGDMGVSVSEIATAPGEYDVRAKMTDFIRTFDDPLQIEAPLEMAAKQRAATLCAPHSFAVTTIAREPPFTDVFMHVVCR